MQNADFVDSLMFSNFVHAKTRREAYVRAFRNENNSYS